MELYDEDLLHKIDSGQELNRAELKLLIFDSEVETIEGESGRWTRSVQTISKLGDRYFSTFWEQGLTEYQENEFYEQPVEVEKKTYEKTITVTEWVPVKKEY